MDFAVLLRLSACIVNTRKTTYRAYELYAHLLRIHRAGTLQQSGSGSGRMQVAIVLQHVQLAGARRRGSSSSPALPSDFKFSSVSAVRYVGSAYPERHRDPIARGSKGREQCAFNWTCKAGYSRFCAMRSHRDLVGALRCDMVCVHFRCALRDGANRRCHGGQRGTCRSSQAPVCCGVRTLCQPSTIPHSTAVRGTNQ
jgi:hypothetical protein